MEHKNGNNNYVNLIIRIPVAAPILVNRTDDEHNSGMN